MSVMSSNGCPNASNPYHQCTQACSQKIKGPKPHANRKTSQGYGRTVTDAEIGKKINEQRRTVAGCPKASNPYHNCDANCNKSFSNSGATPQSNIERKKRAGSRPEPPILDSVPAARKIGATNLSNASSTKPQYSENKKLEPKSNEIIPSSGPISGQLHIPDVMPVYHKDQVKDVAKILPNKTETNHEDKVASDEIIPITNSDDTGLSESKDFSFSGTPPEDKEDGSEGETDSVVSESRIPVGKYNVKESFGFILQTILDKYGDIGASCDLESVVMRSYYMECVCFVVQELQSSSDTIKNIELISHQQDMETEKANYDVEMESLREQLESELKTLAQKEQEVADINARIPEIRDRLTELENKSSGLVDHEITLPIKSKIDQLL